MQKTGENLSIKLVPYRITAEKEHYIVEHLQTGEFFEMPQPAVDAIEALEKGTPPEQIELELTSKYPNEEINMMDFLTQLEEMGFILHDADEFVISGDKLEEIRVEEPSSNKLAKIGKIIFHTYVIPIYTLLFCLSTLFFIYRSDLFPQPRDLFPFQSMVLNILISLLVSVSLLAIHESGHVIAARAFGIIPSVRLGHRLFLPVIETQMPTIWRLPRGRRNIPILAGLFMDHTILFISLSILIFVPTLSVVVTGILGLIILELVMMSLYQCMFFMKTDLYYLIQNVSGSYNLMENARGWLKGKLPFVRSQNSTVIYEKERNIVRGYAIFYILGLIFSTIIFVFYVIPQFKFSFTVSFERLTNPSGVTTKADAIIFFAQFIVYAGLLIYSWFKKFIGEGIMKSSHGNR